MTKRQHVCIWTGGQPGGAPEIDLMAADALPDLPAPTPLRRAARIDYCWGDSRFEILATACSIRTADWGGTAVTWLHCKAMQTSAIRTDEPTGLMTVLIPAGYVTRIEQGPTFRPGRCRPSEDDLGVFPPNQPAPADALPPAEVERGVADLLTPERN